MNLGGGLSPIRHEGKLAHVVRDPRTGLIHQPHETVEIVRRATDSIERSLIYARFADGASIVLFATDIEEERPGE